ncbi:hypothetical protein HER15_03465 [Tenacibaculum mesophilum]|uniref:Uncharacterized protein n=1 Tax=Tenacibaculum mesophilum TaxID=104268 RepID=A0AAE9MM76_9FLAO|nr:hypothetical protein [Tenacibaculum mesophilum]UTD14589.1 hypothetical protein HER15_03465 [Tenacibaculum mesophilum]
MKKGWLKNSVTYLFLVLFLSVKMTGIHVLMHTDDMDHAVHCTMCDHSITHDLTPALTPNFQNLIIDKFEIIVQKSIIKNYRFTATSNFVLYQLFSRPPPFLL